MATPEERNPAEEAKELIVEGAKRAVGKWPGKKATPSSWVAEATSINSDQGKARRGEESLLTLSLKPSQVPKNQTLAISIKRNEVAEASKISAPHSKAWLP